MILVFKGIWLSHFKRTSESLEWQGMKAYFSRRTGSWVRWRRGSSTIVAIHALFSSSIVRISGRKLRLISWAWIQLKTTEMQRSLCFFIGTAIFATLLFLLIGRGNFFDAWWSLRFGFGWKSRGFLATDAVIIAWTSLQFGRFALE